MLADRRRASGSGWGLRGYSSSVQLVSRPAQLPSVTSSRNNSCSKLKLKALERKHKHFIKQLWLALASWSGWLHLFCSSVQSKWVRRDQFGDTWLMRAWCHTFPVLAPSPRPVLFSPTWWDAPALILYAPLLLSPPLTCLDWFVITTGRVQTADQGTFYSQSSPLCLFILISNPWSSNKRSGNKTINN